ncbi:hypothetical protein RD792_009325 [Penstemon davidsonii]|uniref:Uncharacterized protein n=1 Tax=Penstemon davidsonii TaxID=160366 RepID=A0ABR0CYQ2_9LAMI|nr:hypothetical protein RD792_009325 [Penstemon davidsonii]
MKGKKGTAEQGMEAFEKLRLGVGKLMQKYPVQTCGYCPEVQVGPKGHWVRQSYVWHVADSQDALLIDALKRYYGKLPAVVELFAQAGAKVGENYHAMMREDVVVPRLDELKLVV